MCDDRYPEHYDPEADVGYAWSRYELWTDEDGKIRGRCSTNDNLDYGIPTEHASWDVLYPDKETMLRNLGGGSHTGCIGARVTVHLDGVEIRGGKQVTS